MGDLFSKAGKTLESVTEGREKRPCNLCGEFFSPRQQFLVFCDRCRTENEVYLFSEWLPEGSLDDMTPWIGKVAA